MALIIATGSNLGDRKKNLQMAAAELKLYFPGNYEESRIYSSPAIEYLNQPDFYNQVLQFSLPQLPPETVMKKLLQLELRMGRKRDIPKGPRTIDIDILFWGQEIINSDHLQIPHPRWQERSFVVLPLQELSYSQVIAKHFTIPKTFNNSAIPLET